MQGRPRPRPEDVRRGISALWDTLQCPVCLDLMVTPVSTKCDHQFCKFCIQKLLDGAKQREAKCPVCKTEITKRSLQESPGFQRLISGLQNMIEAYENDTRTNYFTGLSLQRRQQRVTESEGTMVSSGDTSVNHHDSGDSEEHGFPGSHSSTVEAQNGFASLMDLEDSNCCVVINEGLDTSLSETPETSGEKMHVHVGISPIVEPVTEQEVAEVVEKTTSRPRTRGKRRLALLENPPSRLSLVPDDDQQRRAPKDDAEKGTDNPEKVQRKQKKSVEKVSQWLLQVPLTENLESEVNPDFASGPEHPPASPTGSCSSASTIITIAKPEVNQKTEQVKSLEDQVFGVVYSRRGRRPFSPPQHPVELFSRDPSLVDEEHNPTADIGESSEPIPDDYAIKSHSKDNDGVDGAEGVVEIQLQMTNEQSSDAGRGVSKEPRALDQNADVNEIGKRSREQSEEPSPQDEEEQDEGEASSLAFTTAVLQLERKSTNLTRHIMQDVDTGLQEQTTAKQVTAAKRRPGRRKGKTAKRQNRTSVRGRKPPVVVGALEAVSEMPQSGLECGGVQVQIETYPSSEELGTRSTHSRRPQHVAQELQESSAGKRLNKRATSTRGPETKVPGPDKDIVAESSEEARTIISDGVNHAVGNATKRNGCICDEDIGGIEKIEGPRTDFGVTEVVTQMNGSIDEVPNTASPCEVSAACFLPTATTRSPTEAAVPSPAPESIGPANQNGALIEDAPPQMDCVEMEEAISDSEVDTEQLLKSFKAAKRKSFHLGSPKRKRRVVSSDEKHLNSKMEDNCGSEPERTTNQISSAAEESATVRSEKPPEIETSGDLVPSSNSPSGHTSLSGVRPRRGLRRRLVQSEEVMKVDSTVLMKSQDSAVGRLSGNTVSSALSPNKPAKSQTQSAHCSVAPDTSDSVLLFSALEVSEDGSLGVASRTTTCLQIAKNTPQPTERKLDAVTLPNTRLCISSETSSVDRRGNTDNGVEPEVNTNGSITPDGLVPPVVEESADKVPASSGLSAGSSIKKNTTRKRKAQRLESSSESSEEELPTLAQIFQSRPAVQGNHLEGQAETQKCPGRVSGREEPSASAAGPPANRPARPPSPDDVESSQASVDLFDTPTECDTAALDVGVSMDSSQFSSDLLVTQQKLAMQQELLRLGDLIGLVTEVLQDKEDETPSDLIADPRSTVSPGHDLPMPRDQEVKQTASEITPIKGRDSTTPRRSVANHVAATPPCPVKHGNTAETVPQISTATRHSARLGGEDPRTPISPGPPPPPPRGPQTRTPISPGPPPPPPRGPQTRTPISPGPPPPPPRGPQTRTPISPGPPPPPPRGPQTRTPISPGPPPPPPRGPQTRTPISPGPPPPPPRGPQTRTPISPGPPPPPPRRPETRDAVTGDRATGRTSASDPAHTSIPPWVFVLSGLGSNEQATVKKFAKRIGARVVPQVTPEVTHVIMCTDEELVCERTLKYFLGIAGRKWVVSFLWIAECFKRGELLEESAFEVRGDVVNGADHRGPLRARGTTDQDLLMKGYEICIQGSFPGMTTDQMEWMVELCGAVVVKDPLHFHSRKRAHQLLIVQPGATPPGATPLKPSALSRRTRVVTRGWLLDSVSTYSLQDHGSYST